MSSGPRRSDEQHGIYARQATILRKNMLEWDRMLRNPRGEDWPTMLGRLNAALNQSANLNRSIEDVMDHFVYLPKQSTANPQDIPFFLSTRLEAPDNQDTGEESVEILCNDPIQQLAVYESKAAQLAAEFERNLVRF
jgi:hypothetical protein